MRRVFLFFLLSLPLGAASASADAITITGGFLYAAGTASSVLSQW